MSQPFCQCPERTCALRGGIRVTVRDWENCSGNCPPERPCDEAYAARMRRKWARKAGRSAEEQAAQAQRSATAAIKPPGHGPGTELREIFHSLGITPKQGCQCKTLANRMDFLGVAGCREHAAEILARLREQQVKLGWVETIKAAALAVASGLAFKLDPTDPAPGLLAEAIRRAEAKASLPT